MNDMYRHRIGFFLMLGAGFFYSVISCFSYSLEMRLSTPQIIFLQDSIALLSLIPLIVRKKCSLRTSYLTLHLWRDLGALAAGAFWLLSLKTLNLVDASILQFTSPFYVPFFGFFWYRESIPKGIWKAILFGFFGVILMMKPDIEIFHNGTIWGILAGIASAVGLTALRQLNLKGESFERTIFYLFLVSATVSCPFALANWNPISWNDATLVSLLGICILINNIFLTRAFKHAPASYLAPMSYIIVLFNGILGWIFFQDSIDFITITGGVLILAGTSLIYFLKDRQSQKT